MLDRIHWLGHASFRFNGPPHSDGLVVYVDPWRLPPDSPLADVVLITHEHHDHCSSADIDKIRHSGTLVLGNDRVREMLGGIVQVVRPWEGAVNCGDFSIRGVPAYTAEKAYHAKEFGGLGYIVSARRYDIYIAGDTDVIEEMGRIGCDVAILPVGGGVTMDYLQAVEAAKLVKCSWAIPMHYGREVLNSKENGRLFKQAAEKAGIEAIILPIENSAYS